MATTYWLLLVTCMLAASQLADGQRGRGRGKCPSRCVSCDNGVAECAKRSLLTPPKDFPRGIKRINMDNNLVRVLGAKSFQKLDKVEVLRLKGNKLRLIRKSAFSKLPKLMTLDLSENQLVKIYGKGFTGMASLQTLSLQYNRLRSITRIFDYTPRLYQLNLAFNKLRSLGKSDLKTPTRIHYLDLRNNRITKIHPEAFAHLEFLRYLFLNKNPLVTVPDLTFASNVLQLVDFERCKLTHVPTTMPQSVTDFRLNDNNIMQINDTDFKNMTKMRLLALNNNDLHFVANRAFKDLHELDEIWLRGNKLVYIPRSLPDNLRKLHMDSNRIRRIEEGLFSNISRLDYLTVENNRINRISNETFKGLKFLRSLNFRGNRLKVIEAGTFDSLGNLTTLSLSNNPIERIADGAFGNLGNLTFLHLDNCGEKSSLEQNFLSAMVNLQKLSMMNSPGLGKAFVKMIDGTPMTPLKKVTEIDLTYNDIHTMSPNIQEVFPALNALSLDGNSWLCDRRLAWLTDWMANSDISFSKYEPVICEQPRSLKGREIRDLDESEFVEVAPTPEPPSAEDYSQMLKKQKHDELEANQASSRPVPSNMIDSPAKAGNQAAGAKAVSKVNVESPTTKRLRKYRKKLRSKTRRMPKGKGRKRRGKKGNGRRRRNKKNKANKKDIKEAAQPPASG